MRLPRENRRSWLAACVLVIVAVVVAGLAARDLLKSSVSKTYNPNVGFKVGKATTTVVKGKKFIWPIYGFNDARTRVFDGPAALNDPADLTVRWTLPGNGPLEFPPDIDGNVLFFMDDGATVNKVNATTGHRYWRYRVGTLSSASPAIDPKLGLLYVPVLSKTGTVPGDGQFVAMSMKTGKVKWKIPLAYGSESSPLIHGDNVYFGDSGGTVHDVNAITGAPIWSFPTGGAVKGGPTLANGILYFANYAGDVYAVTAAHGKQVWEQSIGGTVYASPTIAYGRIYVGTTAGGEYSLSTKAGVVAWSVPAGGYVYSSAAVDDTPGLGPTVYFGSYSSRTSGSIFAVNAKTGAVDWQKQFGGSVSGAASIVNDTVFFSSVYSGNNFSKGYNITTGAQDFSFPDGAYTTTVASPKAIFLSGHYKLYGLFPKKK